MFGVEVSYISGLRVHGVMTLECHFSFNDHITSVIRVCNHHMRALHHNRPLINGEIANISARSFACSRLVYCNSILYGVTESNMDRLQRVQNALARMYVQHHTAHLHLAYGYFNGFRSGSGSATRKRRSHSRYEFVNNQFTLLISSSTTHNLDTASQRKGSTRPPLFKTLFTARAFRVAAPRTSCQLT